MIVICQFFIWQSHSQNQSKQFAGFGETTDSDCPGDADRPILVTSDIDADAGPASLPCDVCAQMEGIDKEPASSYCVVCERKFCAEHLKVC